jgi:two-component system phosphate regulon sensor histidine kinase PhoR
MSRLRELKILLIPASLALGGVALAAFSEYGPLSDHVMVIDLTAVFFWAGMVAAACSGVAVLAWRIGGRRAAARAASDLRAAKDERDHLVRAIRHEIKNPLSTVMGEIDLMQGYGTMEQRDQRSLSIIRDTVRRTSTLINQLSELTHLEQRYHPQRADIKAIVEDAFREALQGAPGRAGDVSVNHDSDAAASLVRVDYDLVVEAVRNVLDNSLKYSASGDRVMVSTWPYRETVVIEVEDNGPGVPVDEIPMLTSELYRGEFARGHAIPGLGIGLAFVRRVVQLHGGRIDIRRRTKPGENGLVVRLTLPAAK